MPTFYHGSRAKLYLNGYDISTYIRSVKGGIKVDTAEVSTLGETAKKYIPGLQDATFSCDGIYDGVANRIDTILSNAVNASESSVATWVINYDIPGRVAYGMDMSESNYEFAAGMGDAATFTFAGQPYSTGGQERCIILLTGSYGSGCTTGSIYNYSPSNAYGGVLFIQQLSQAGSVRWNLQHSGDNFATACTTILTGSYANTASGAAARYTASGSVYSYVRLTASCNDGSALMHAAFGRKYFDV